MSDLCLDEGILQSYYDDQLEPKVLDHVVSHLASCAKCTEAVRQIESDMDLATAAFAPEMTLSVPTQRLRSRIDAAISQLDIQPIAPVENSRSRFGAWLATLAGSFNLTPRQAFGFASLLVFFAISAVVVGNLMRSRDLHTGAGVVADNQGETRDLSFNGPETSEPIAQADSNDAPTRKRAGMRSTKRTATGLAKTDTSVETAHRVLPGERNYLQAISLLTDAIEANGENSLKPTLLTDYRRNLEVVDQAIKATQRTARTNPKSPDAAEMLFAVYQSKLDLLSAVAEQSKPMIAQR